MHGLSTIQKMNEEDQRAYNRRMAARIKSIHKLKAARNRMLAALATFVAVVIFAINII